MCTRMVTKDARKGANSGHGVTGGITFSVKIKAHRAVSSQKCPIGLRRVLDSVISRSISFALLLLGCRLPQHALVPVPGG